MAITDKETNFVYISGQLKRKYKDTYSRLTALFDELGINWGEIFDTNDIWARDYMPFQLDVNTFVRYKYDPDYLKDKKYRKLRTDNSKLTLPFTSDSIKVVECPYIIDGGNLTLCGDYIVATDKLFTENGISSEEQTEFLNSLRQYFGHEFIIISWHCLDPEDEYADVYGHSDGFINWCGGNRILMSNHREADPEEASQIKHILESYGFDVTEILFSDKDDTNGDWNWAYVNYLHVGNNIIVPVFGIKEDRQALDYIRQANPDCKVAPLRLRDVASNGGALHCITWNVLMG